MKSMTRLGGLTAAWLLLAGCNSQESAPVSAPSDNSSAEGPLTQEKYAEAVLKLKHTIHDPALLNQKVLELKEKYSSLDRESAIQPGYLAGPVRIEPETPVTAQPLQKAASTSGLLVKNYQTYIRQTYRGGFTNGPAYTVVTVTAQAIGTADPFLVVYENNGPNGGAIPNNTGVIDAYDDDGGGGLSSRVSFTATRSLTNFSFIVFSANAEGGIGNVNVTVNLGGQITTYNNVPARGVGAVSNNVAVSPCTFSSTPISNFAVTNSNISRQYFFSMDARGPGYQMTFRQAPTTAIIGYDTRSLSQWTPDYSVDNKPNFAISFTDPGYPEGLGYLKQWDSCN